MKRSELKPIPGVCMNPPPGMTEADHFVECLACGQAIDRRDLAQVLHHMNPGHKPLEDNA